MSDITQNLLDTISMMTAHAVSNAQFDRTIEAVIMACEDQALGIYKVRYQDSIWRAYSSNTDTKYSAGTSVYILVPGNNMSKNKTILGAVSSFGKDYIDYVSNEQNYIENGNSVVTLDTSQGLCSYIQNNNINLYTNNNQPFVSSEDFHVDQIAAKQYLSTSEYIILKADFQTDLPKQQRRAGNYGLKVVLQFKVPENPEKIVEREYILDIDNMVGNPYLFPVPLTQKAYFAIDGVNFIKIKSVNIFNKDFEHAASGMPEDIFISNIEIIGANVLTQQEKQGLSLRFKRPKGYIFTSGDLLSNTKTVIAQIRVKNRLLSSTEKVEYYWFKQDLSITAGSQYYSKYGGKGWRCLNTQNTSQTTDIKFLSGTDTFFVKKQDILCERITYKCVVIYDGKEISNTFQIINMDAIYDIILTCDQEPVFYPNVDTLHLTCVIKSNDSETSLTYSEYHWYMITQYGNYYSLGQQTNTGTLTVQSSNIQNYNDYYCAVYGAQSTFIGTAHIRITKNIEPQNRYILSIVDGVQVFNYDEMGNSPYSEYIQNNLTIPQLSFTVIDIVTGFDVTDQVKEITWTIPLKNTLLIDENQAQHTEEQGAAEREYTTLQNFVYGIQNRFSAKFTNNDIKLKVLIHGIELSAKTNFTFIKEGDSGTNGTGIICKIVATKNDQRVSGWLIGTYQNDTLNNGNITKSYNWDRLSIELWQNGQRILGGSDDISNVTIKWEFLSNGDNTLWYTIPTETVNNTIRYTSQQIVEFNDAELNVNSINFDATKGYSANILKATVKFNNEDRQYFDTIPIATIFYDNTAIPTIENSGFKYVVYSEDGENPQYDDLVPFTITQNQNREVNWKVVGSIKINNNVFKNLTQTNLIKDSFKNKDLLEHGNQLYVKPKTTYDGLCVTNAVIASGISGTTTPAFFWVHFPVHFMYNRYGHKQLNDWDGNSIQINKDKNYILAPQIGAGVKNGDNSFTGVFMGTVHNYEGNTDQIGLFGYNSGQRTIFLDSKTGKAEFGKQGAGRIIINPSDNRAIIEGGNYTEGHYQVVQSQDIFSDGESQTVYVPGTGMRIDLTTPEIRFGSGNFIVDSTGFLTSKKGEIGPWHLVDSCIYYKSSGSIENPELGTSSSSKDYIYLGTQGLSLGKNFIYNSSNGKLTLNVSSLSIGGTDINQKIPGSGKNLFSRGDLSVLNGEVEQDWENGYKYTVQFDTSSDTYFNINTSNLKNNTYILSYDFTFESGAHRNLFFGKTTNDISFKKLTIDTNDYSYYVKNEQNVNTREWSMGTYHVELVFTINNTGTSEGDIFVSGGSILLWFNKDQNLQSKISLLNIMIEEGSKSSEWEPSTKDSLQDIKASGETATNYLYFQPTGKDQDIGLYISTYPLTESNYTNRHGGNIRLTDDGLHIYHNTKQLVHYGTKTIFYRHYTVYSPIIQQITEQAATLGADGLTIKKGIISLGSLSSASVPSSTTESGLYIDNTGKFFLGKSANYIQWNGTTLTLQGNYNQTGGYISLGSLTNPGNAPTSGTSGFRVSSAGLLTVGNSSNYIAWNTTNGLRMKMNAFVCDVSGNDQIKITNGKVFLSYNNMDAGFIGGHYYTSTSGGSIPHLKIQVRSNGRFTLCYGDADDKFTDAAMYYQPRNYPIGGGATEAGIHFMVPVYIHNGLIQ